jgi:peptidoglycan/LPS O-acetylase OafA/YrhL
MAVSNVIPAGTVSRSDLKLRGHLARKLRVDPGDKAGHVKIYSLELTSNFGPPVTFDPADIYKRFIPNAAISSYRLENDHVSFDVVDQDPQLILKDELIIQNRFISIVLPIVFTFAFYLAISHFGRSSFPAFYDLTHHKSSANLNYASLDGIRGIAVLLVLLDHTIGFFTGAGTAGVWIFFVLSGFLLAIPFVRKPELAVSGEYMNEYLLRRLKRIIPMYYFFIIVTFFFFGKFDSASFRHLLFLQGNGHLWTIPQEMLFYLFLPFIMIANYLVFRGRAIWIVAALTVMMVLSNIYLDKSVFSMYGGSITRPAFVGIFLCGILFSYLYHGVIAGNTNRILQSGNFKSILSVIGIILLVCFILLGRDTLFEPKTFLANRHSGWFGLAAGMMILLVLMAPRTFYDKLLSWLPLRALGLVGFSFYLLHPIVISLVKGIQDYYLGYRMGVELQFFVIMIITYFFAAFTYSYIERPFLKLAKK